MDLRLDIDIEEVERWNGGEVAEAAEVDPAFQPRSRAAGSAEREREREKGKISSL